MSSIIRRRSGLTVLVSLIGRSFLSEVERPSILRTGLPVAPSLSYRLATRPPGSHPRAAGRSGATSCHGALLTYREGQQRARYDAFARPPANSRYLRKRDIGLERTRPVSTSRRHWGS